jgi:hypothetical protein
MIYTHVLKNAPARAFLALPIDREAHCPQTPARCADAYTASRKTSKILILDLRVRIGVTVLHRGLISGYTASWGSVGREKRLTGRGLLKDIAADFASHGLWIPE